MEQAKALAKMKNKMEAEANEIRMEKIKEFGLKLLKNEDDMLWNLAKATVGISILAGAGLKATTAAIRFAEAYIAKPKLGIY